MEDLIKQAIVLIYPDGEIEKIPITNFVFHIDYLFEHLKKSKKFAKIVQGLKIKSLLPVEIYEVLVKNNIMVWHNYNIEAIVKDKTFLEKNLPYFFVFLKSFESREQLLSFMKIFDYYPNELMMIGLLETHNNKKDRFKEFQEINFNKIEDMMDMAKDKFGIQNHKL